MHSLKGLLGNLAESLFGPEPTYPAPDSEVDPVTQKPTYLTPSEQAKVESLRTQVPPVSYTTPVKLTAKPIPPGLLAKLSAAQNMANGKNVRLNSGAVAAALNQLSGELADTMYTHLEAQAAAQPDPCNHGADLPYLTNVELRRRMLALEERVDRLTDIVQTLDPGHSFYFDED